MDKIAYIAYHELIDRDARERFNSFRNSVEKNGFFLGFCKKDEVKHLVLVLADPKIKNKQETAFIFPYMPPSDFRNYSLAPNGIVSGATIIPLSDDIAMWMTVDGALELFRKAAASFRSLACPI